MDESFLPYAMIRPLIRKGTTKRQLARKIARRLGISDREYGAVYVIPRSTFAESLLGGVRIVKRDDPSFRSQPNFAPWDEPVR